MSETDVAVHVDVCGVESNSRDITILSDDDGVD